MAVHQPIGAVVVRQIWEDTMVQEFNLIQQCAYNGFRFMSVDTEFPGTVFTIDVPKHIIPTLSPADHYLNMKKNVDDLKIIQLGLTISDAHGNLPRLGTDSTQYVWQFNFRNFDADVDLCNRDSISLLRSQGIDFSETKRRGIRSNAFSWIFRNSGLGPSKTERAWVTFHGLYDFGFMIKILTWGQPLPNDLVGFMKLVRLYFGPQVYDLKPIAREHGLHGGLEKVAKSLGFDRAACRSHLAGSDSLLTLRAFFGLVMNRFNTSSMLRDFNYKLYGLTSFDDSERDTRHTIPYNHSSSTGHLL